MATFHTFQKKTHSEVAAVLKLSRSRFAKPDISASVRVSAQKVLPNCYPHCLVFQLLFSLCLLESGVGEGVGLMVVGGGGGGLQHEKCVCPEGKVQRRVFKDSLG